MGLRFWRSVWLFPALLFLVVCLLAAFRISGSSVGMYHTALYGDTVKDPNLVLGEPRPIRSDEWLVGTPFIVSQSHFGYPVKNPAVGGGFDASVLADVPYKDWSMAFKPQNLSFFVLPLEHAFAFKWWFIGYLLIVSVYFLVLAVLPGRRLLAALLGLGMFVSPFVQWWYLSGTILPLTYSCLAVLLVMKIIRAETIKSKFWLGAALAYILSCFALMLYPPFQIPCALAAIAMGAGIWLNRRWWISWRKLFVQLIPIVAAIAVAGLVVGTFLLTRLDTVHAITNTVYPGHRVEASGGFFPYHFMDGFLDGQLQDPVGGIKYLYNQSTVASFIFLWPYLLIPSILVLVGLWRKERAVDWALVFVNALLLVFCIRIFVPTPEVIWKLLGLSSIPHDRLIIGFGLLNLFQLILLTKHLNSREAWQRKWAVILGLVAFGVQLLVGLHIRGMYPGYVSRLIVITPLALAVGIIVYLVIDRKATWAALLLLVLNISATYAVNPLYRGLGELTHSKITQAAVSEPGGKTEAWAYFGSNFFINLLPASGAHSYSATYVIPQVGFWKKFDPTGKYMNVYNRYGYATFTIDDPKVTEFKLNFSDSYAIDYEPCEEPFRSSIKHVLSQVPLDKSCLVFEEKIAYPLSSYFIYRVQ